MGDAASWVDGRPRPAAACPRCGVVTPYPDRPRLLDLFCGAGGCAKGYQRAGFYVVGVDSSPQPNYCGEEFVQMDALAVLDRLAVAGDDDGDERVGVVPFDLLGGGDGLRGGVEGVLRASVDGDGVVEAHGSSLVANPDDSALPAPLVKGFDAIHASPPCQGYSALKGLTAAEYPKLIEPVRELLLATGLPYVIENVVGAPLLNPIRLCGSSFGLRVWRHRLFEMSHPPVLVPPCSHVHHPLPIDVTGTGGPSTKPRISPGGGLSRKPRDLAEARWAMGIDWMSRAELAEAIPPAFTEWVGRHLLAEVERRARVAA